MWTAAEPLPVSPEHRQILERWVRAPSTPQSVVARARVVLMAAEVPPTTASPRSSG